MQEALCATDGGATVGIEEWVGDIQLPSAFGCSIDGEANSGPRLDSDVSFG
jgi:hypothetical protein